MPKLELPSGVKLHWVRGGRGNESEASPEAALEATSATPSEAPSETIVFVNGLTMDTSAWRAVAERLGERCATLRYDCRGQGESDKPDGPYPPETHAQDLLELLAGLGLGRVHLVGLSNGGLVALLAAARAPERVRSLAMIDSFGAHDAPLRLILDSWRGALEAGGAGLRFDVAAPWVWGQAFLNAHLGEVLALRERAAEADPAAVGHLIAGLAGFGSALDAFERYRGPFLALVGADDLLTPPRYSRALVEAAGRGKLVVLPEAGHAAPLERPAAVAQALAAFLEGAR